ncbi:cysteine methyltransferase [Archaeoglobales archaeon]|nr:MAG: cysteine methyltransferase [Archaeoglobales archaeon]
MELVVIDLRDTDLSPFFLAHLEDGVIVKSGFSSRELEESIRTPVARKLRDDLYAYFSGKKIDFNYAVRLSVPEFTARVLSEVSKIPYGKTKTYKEVAERLGTKAYRAVGGALARNPIPVIIPCHRVIGMKDLGGYMGGKESGIRIKRILLEIEGHRL